MVAISSRIVRVDVIEKVTFEQRLEGIERISQVDIWGKGTPDKGNSKAGVCLVCLRNSRKLGWLEQWAKDGGGRGPWKIGRGSKDLIMCWLVGHCRGFYFYTVGLLL